MARLDFSLDQACMDNLEAVTYTSVRAAGDLSVAVPDAGFYDRGLSEAAPSYGVYTRGLARFVIRKSLLEGVGGVKPRDTVAFGGDTYTVLSADHGEITGVWQIDAVNLVLAADLRQTASVLRPPEAQDAGGRLALESYATIYESVPCRLQPLDSSRTEALGRATAPRRYTCYLGVQVWPVRARDVLVVGTSRYTIDAARSPERIDQLPELEVTEID